VSDPADARLLAALRLSDTFAIQVDRDLVVVWISHTQPPGREVEFVGRHVRDLLGPGAWESVRPDLEAVVAGGEPRRAMLEMVRADRPLAYSAVFAAGLDEAGRVVRVDATLTDVTALRAAERSASDAAESLERQVADRVAALASSEARYRELFEHVDAVVWEANPDGSAWFSPSADRVLGHPAAVFEAAETWKTLIAEPEPEPRRSEVISLLTGNTSARVEYRLLDGSGNLRWMRDQMTVLPRPEGGEPRRIGVTLDITAQRMAQEQFRLAVDLGSDPFVILEPVRDADGTVRDFLFSFCNVASVTVTGAGGEPPVTGSRLSEIWPADFEDGFFERYRAASNGTPFSGEVSMVRDGRTCWLDLRLASLPDGRVSMIWRDTTAAREAAERLRESEERLRRTIDGLEGVVVYRERADGPIWYSPPASRVLGHDPGEIAGFDTYERFVHPDDLAACRATWDGDDEAWTLEYRFQRGDGTWIWLRDRAHRVRGANGWDRLYGVLDDVTAAHAAAEEREEAILARERLYRELIERGDAITWVTKAQDNGNEYISPQVRGILGYEPERWYEPGFWRTTVHPDDLGLVETSTGANDTAEFEYRAITSDGRIVWFLERVRTLFDERGNQLRRIGVSFDVTARKAAEAELRASEEQFRTLVDELDAVVFAIDRDGRIWTSHQATKILGYEPERLASKHDWRSMVHEDDRERVYAAWSDPDVDRVELEYRIRRGDGELIWVSEHLRAVRGDSGQQDRWFGLLIDVTERRLLRDRLLRRARAEDVGRLAAAAAHDFDNVLLGISIHARKMAVDEEDPSRSEDLERIIEAAERGNALVRQLLDFGRASDHPLKPIDLVAAVARIEPLLARLAGPGIKLVLRGGPDPVQVVLDDGTLEQILCNLVLNARDAMPDGGRLTVEVGEAVLDEAERPGPGRFARIAVHDTGVGMARDVAARAFEPFFTTKVEGEGSGLGLASVRHLVRTAGGEVRLDTAPGAGTTVELLLAPAR